MKETGGNAGRRWIDSLRGDLVPAMLLLLAMLLLAPRLDVPPRYMFDEVYHAYTAGQYVAGNADAYLWSTDAPRADVAYMWNHPPAGVLMIAGGIALWGDHPFGWRFSSALFGSAGVLLVYLLGLRLSRDRVVASIGALLLLTDTLWFVQSRVGMLDIFGAVFSTAALFSFCGYLTAPPERIVRSLTWTGLFLGLALATKWNAAFVSVCCGLLVLYRAARAWRTARIDPRATNREAWRAHRIGIPLGFAVIPALVYLAAYIPFFATGHDWAQFVELQRQIFVYHTRLEATHPYQSLWWEWPFALCPVWYSVTYTPQTVAHIFANGNPLLYWSFIPSVSAASVAAWRRRDPSLPILLIGFFGQWLPWALSPRSAFAYHFLPAVPFGCIATAWVAVKLWRRGGGWRWFVVVYLSSLVVYFVLAYPIHAAIPVDSESWIIRRWIPAWQ